MPTDINLAFQNLTVRFGGLTAVDSFDFDVERGKILSIIGPNGAGKTTAFNVASGIYQPTSGRVLVQGRTPTRPLTWKVFAMCGLVGLVTGAALFLMTHNVDKLWMAAIKRNMADKDQAFSYRDAARDGLAYLRGELALELKRRRWRVVTADGSVELQRVRVPRAADEQTEAELAADARRQAEQIRQNYEAIIALGGSDATLREQGGVWSIRSPEEGRVLAEFPTRERAVLELQTCGDIDTARHRRSRAAWVLSVIGLVLGAAGTFSVWHESRRTPDVIMRGGIARTFQNIRVFPDMTVLENVLVGMERRFAASIPAMMFRTSAVRTAEEKAHGRAMQLLEWVGLNENWNVLARNLPYGAARRLEIARALATKPRILLLDEPAAGMNPAEANELMALIREIKRQRVTVLLIEHHMRFVMNISDRIAVMHQGVKIADGTPDEVRANPKVIEAYLGQPEADTSQEESS